MNGNDVRDKLQNGRFVYYKSYEPTGVDNHWGYTFTPTSKEIRYGDWEEKPAYFAEEGEQAELYISDYMSGSDYSGSSVEYANYTAFKEEFGEIDGVYIVSGGFSTYAIAVDVTVENDELWETLVKLEDYPVINEDTLYEIEQEAEEEAWKSWAESDFRSCLKDAIEQQTLPTSITDLNDEEKDSLIEYVEDCDDNTLYELFDYARKTSNTYWVHETGNSASIDIERIVKYGLTEDILLRWQLGMLQKDSRQTSLSF